MSAIEEFRSYIVKLTESAQIIAAELENDFESDLKKHERIHRLYEKRQNEVNSFQKLISSEKAKDILNNADDLIKKEYRSLLSLEKENLAKLERITKTTGDKLKNLSKHKSLLIYLEGDKK